MNVAIHIMVTNDIQIGDGSFDCLHGQGYSYQPTP